MTGEPGIFAVDAPAGTVPPSASVSATTDAAMMIFRKPFILSPGCDLSATIAVLLGISAPSALNYEAGFRGGPFVGWSDGQSGYVASILSRRAGLAGPLGDLFKIALPDGLPFLAGRPHPVWVRVPRPRREPRQALCLAGPPAAWPSRRWCRSDLLVRWWQVR